MRFRAYLFDVQGTLLDFFNPVSTAVGHYLNAHEITDVDAAGVHPQLAGELLSER